MVRREQGGKREVKRWKRQEQGKARRGYNWKKGEKRKEGKDE